MHFFNLCTAETFEKRKCFTTYFHFARNFSQTQIKTRANYFNDKKLYLDGRIFFSIIFYCVENFIMSKRVFKIIAKGNVCLTGHAKRVQKSGFAAFWYHIGFSGFFAHHFTWFFVVDFLCVHLWTFFPW